MKTFTDAAGRTWTISLNLGTAMAFKDALGIDLLQPEQPYRHPSSAEAWDAGNSLVETPTPDRIANIADGSRQRAAMWECRLVLCRHGLEMRSN